MAFEHGCCAVFVLCFVGVDCCIVADFERYNAVDKYTVVDKVVGYNMGFETVLVAVGNMTAVTAENIVDWVVHMEVDVAHGVWVFGSS